MADNRGTNDKSNMSNCYESYSDYLKRAAGACEAGDLVLGMHLYLAAYERAVADPDIPDGMAISGLREAWNLACNLKERSMAEYVFEKLEPFLTGEEIAHCASKLQSLALDRLEEYGFSRAELENMAEMISQDLMEGEASVVKVESFSLPNVTAEIVAGTVELDDHGSGELGGEAVLSSDEDFALGANQEEGSQVEAGIDQVSDSGTSEGAYGGPFPTTKGENKPGHVGLESASADFNPYDMYETSSVGKSYHAATNDGAGQYIFTRDKSRAAESERERAKSASAVTRSASSEQVKATEESAASNHGDPSTPLAQMEESAIPAQLEPNREKQPNGAIAEQQGAIPSLSIPAKGGKGDRSEVPAMPEVPLPGSHVLTYRDLAGYGQTISAVRELGVGLQRDGGFRNFIEMMNARHGLDRMPALDTLLFRAPVIEDASRFVDATIGEIGLPVLRMSMEEGFQGAPVLCVTTFGDSRPRMNHAHNRFDGPGILVIDDLDTWSFPQPPENMDGIAGFVMANMSRGAREAMSMIRSAVEDPDVYVLVTATTEGEVESFFYDLLEPISVIDIEYPTDAERDEVWREIMHDHPSMRPLDRGMLVKYSAGMPRYDLYMAARAAIEEAYKMGLVQRMYLSVTVQNILDKLAAYQPLDSDEYRAIEDEIVRCFQGELDDLENLLDSEARG